MDKTRNEESWNKKRIFAAFFLIAALAIGGYWLKTHAFGKSSRFSSDPLVSVKAVSSKEGNNNGEDVSTNIQKTVREKLDDLKREVKGLSILEITSSSAQVQKIINDIKSLEQYPSNEVKYICKQVCGSL